MRQLIRLFEAGLQNAPTGKVKSKWKKFASHDDDDEEVGDTGRTKSGKTVPYYLPNDLDDVESEPSAPPPEKPREPEAPIFGKSAKPSPALQGGKTSGTVKADSKTLEALMKALESVRTSDDDLMDWVDDVVREIRRAVRTGGELTLPKFEATPDLDDFDEDDGAEDEDY